MNGYHVRHAQLKDLKVLPEIEREAAARFAPYGLAGPLSTILTPLDLFREGLEANRLWVAVDETNQPVGFALANVVSDNAHLDELDVHPLHGRRGLGAALVEAVCDWAIAAGYHAVTLTTLRHVPWNAPWYERLGFHVVEESDLSEALRDLLQEEIQRGLPADQRVAMLREL